MRVGDAAHPDRNGDVRPEKSALPTPYQPLVDWYDRIYSKRVRQSKSQARAVRTTTESTPITDFSASSTSSGTDIAFIGPGGSVIIPDNLRRDFAVKEGARFSIRWEKDRIVLQPIDEDLIARLRGSCRGGESLVEVREREHEDDRY